MPADHADDEQRPEAGQALRLLELNRFDEARLFLVAVLDEQGDDAEVLRLLAHACLSADRLPKAWEAARRAVAIAPTSAESHLVMSAVLQRYGKLKEGSAAAEHATRLAPDWAPAWCGLAAVAVGSSDAVSAARRAVAIEPANADCHHALGMALLPFDGPGAAAAAFERVLALDPTSATARSNLGLVHLRRGRVLGAVDSFVGAAGADPRLGVARANVRVTVWRLLIVAHVALFLAALGDMVLIALPELPGVLLYLPAAAALLVGAALAALAYRRAGQVRALRRGLRSSRVFVLLAVLIVPGVVAVAVSPVLPRENPQFVAVAGTVMWQLLMVALVQAEAQFGGRR